MFKSICRDLNLIDWAALFSLKKVYQFVDLFYEAVWQCFDSHVPQLRVNNNVTFPWDSECLHVLKNRSTEAAKKMKRSLSNLNIDNCDGERLRTKFSAGRSEYQSVFNSDYGDFRKGVEAAIKTDPKSFFQYVSSLFPFPWSRPDHSSYLRFYRKTSPLWHKSSKMGRETLLPIIVASQSFLLSPNYSSFWSVGLCTKTSDAWFLKASTDACKGARRWRISSNTHPSSFFFYSFEHFNFEYKFQIII
jgi:hypothetical protein